MNYQALNKVIKKEEYYYWVYNNGQLEKTNCKVRKYRMISSYRKPCNNMPVIKINDKKS